MSVKISIILAVSFGLLIGLGIGIWAGPGVLLSSTPEEEGRRLNDEKSSSNRQRRTPATASADGGNVDELVTNDIVGSSSSSSSRNDNKNNDEGNEGGHSGGGGEGALSIAHSDDHPCPTPVEVNCGELGDSSSSSPYELLAGGIYKLHRANEGGNLCFLVKVVSKQGGAVVGAETMTPLGRSYDGFEWEPLPPHFLHFDCGDKCLVTLPQQQEGTEEGEEERFFLYHFSHTLLTSEDVSRFLNQATFGATSETISDFLSSSFSPSTFLQDQMKEEISTELRKVYRSRSFGRMSTMIDNGIARHPCDVKSRWRNFAFRSEDSPFPVTFEDITGGGGSVLVRVDGIPRTEYGTAPTRNRWDNVLRERVYAGFPAGEIFRISGWSFSNQIGGQIRIFSETDGFWWYLDDGNPPVQFPNLTSYEDEMIVLSLTTAEEDNFEVVNHGTGVVFTAGAGGGGGGNDEEEDITTTTTTISDVQCSSIPQFYPLLDAFAIQLESEWYIYDPALVLEENTLANPISDGGGEIAQLDPTQKIQCSNVPRTFLNEEDGCFLSPEPTTCAEGELLVDDGQGNNSPLLNEETLKNIFELTGRYVYIVDGLRVDPSYGALRNPCSLDIVSRWLKISDDDNPSPCVEGTFPDVETKDALKSLLLSSRGENNVVIDIRGPGCTVDPVLYGIVIEIEAGVCYQHVHHDLRSVYDMTFWASPLPTAHPGNFGQVPNPITRFAEPTDEGQDPTFTLTFPGHHTMDRWEINHVKFTYIGRAGDRIGYHDLPDVLQTVHVADYFGAIGAPTAGSNTLVCGSPGEIANDPSQEYDLANFYVRNGPAENGHRAGLFHYGVLERKDQLRQRVAWALNQILVVNPFDVSAYGEIEIFLNYYDIFVRHAFGNYFDILKEVAYSPMMGQMLSYLNSRSTEYLYLRDQVVIFPDENFAREIMQLFTIGLVKLNADGTSVMDGDGVEVETYDNEDIITGARLWTGFERQSLRGNIEPASFGANRVDPMHIAAGYRDRAPKMNLYDGYVGDGFPLCHELPAKPFLRKGAQFRLLGKKTKPELRHEDPSWETNEFVTRFTLADDENSNLYNTLCAAAASSPGGTCTFPAFVTLENNLDCFGSECDVDTIAVVKMGSYSIYYEYVQQPCVDLAFMNNAMKVQHAWGRYVCGHPKKPMALAACCRTSGTRVIWWDSPTYCEYVGEHMSYDRAEERCNSHDDQYHCESSYLRSFSSPDGDPCLIGRWWYWSSDSCDTMAKINLDNGKIALVHDATSENRNLNAWNHVHANFSVNWFRVNWEDEGNNVLPSSCSAPCQVVEFDGSCLCPTNVVDSPVFTEEPGDLSVISSKNLHIGSLSPDTFDTGTYTSHTWSKNGRTINYWVPTDNGGLLGDTRTIFKVTEKGETHYLRNMVSKVEVVIGENTYQFRNAPHFNSLQDLNGRDAMDETDAYLKHLVYHENTAPFLATRLMQRFGFSNPSPRFVSAVSKAFTVGKYVSESDGDVVEFGSGKLGDLGATIAAILLDREARSSVLDADPIYGSLKEPLMKILQFMRAMKLQLNPDTPLLELELSKPIGQEAFNMPTVFSFFLPEYSPPGVLSAAQLKSPEAYVLNTPKALGFMSGVFSLVKYGITNCMNDWLGYNWRTCNTPEGDYSRSSGRLTFTPTTPAPPQSTPTSADIIDELALLFTPGRLSPENRQTMVNALDSLEGGEGEHSVENSVRLAQQLMLATPEFHTTSNFVRLTGEPRSTTPPPSAPLKPYKAIVFFMLAGGADTYNLLVPYDDCLDGRDMFAHYDETRTVIALEKNDLYPINATDSNQVCNMFGLHPSVPFFKQLYDENDLSFVANTGVLHQVSDKTNYRQNHRTQLFAHNVMQSELKTVDPFQEVAGTGVLGRMGTRLKNLEAPSSPYNVMSVSLGNQGDAVLGEPGIAPPVNFLATGELSTFDPRPSHPEMSDLIEALNGQTELPSSLFAETWSSAFLKALDENAGMKEALDNSQLATSATWNRNTEIERQLEVVARLINVSSDRGIDRDVFYVEIGGWDTHADVSNTLLGLYSQINDAIEGFVNEMKAQNKHDEVLTVISSEFGRTLTPNSGRGSDHAWGGNYVLIGGDVKGAKIHGTYPSDLSDDGPLGLGRGRLVPSTSWEQVWNGAAQWFGLTSEADLDYVLPNRKNFEQDLFQESDLFK